MTLSIINKYLVLFEAACFFFNFLTCNLFEFKSFDHQFSLKDISKTDTIAYKKEQL